MVGKTALEGFKRPDNATRMRDIIESIAKDVADGKAAYRMATVATILPDSLEVEFPEEPGNLVTIENLPHLRPAAIGQQVEILIRDRTDFSLWRIYGPVVSYGVTPYVPPLTDAVTGLALATANRAIVASWDALDGATTYDVQRAKDAGFTVEDSLITVTGTQHTATDLDPGDGWFYRVRGKNVSGSGDWSFVESVVVGTDTPAPNPPSTAPTLTVTEGERSLTTTWSTLAEADHYEVQYSQSETFASGNTTQVVQGSQFTRSGLTTGETWHYRVRAVNTAGSGPWSLTAAGTVVTGIPAPAGPPVQVVGLALSSSYRSLSIVWNPQTVADTYEVMRSKSSGFASGNVTSIVSGSTLMADNLIAGEVWYVRVRAINAAGTGAWSGTQAREILEDSTAIGLPGGIAMPTIEPTVAGAVMTWFPNSNATSYAIQVSADTTFATPVVSRIVEGTQITLFDLIPDTTYYFRVRGVNSRGAGSWSIYASAHTLLPSELTDGDAPIDSPAVTVSPGLGLLQGTWPVQANDDPVTYEVHLSTTSGFTPNAGTKLGETSGTFWITTKTAGGTPLVADTTYFMRVIAKDADGAAGPGAQGSGVIDVLDLGEAGSIPSTSLTGDGEVPPTPTAPVVTSGIGYLYLTWAGVTNVDPVTYEVHVSTASNFVPDANTLSFTTMSHFGFLRKQGAGTRPGEWQQQTVNGNLVWVWVYTGPIPDLEYGTTYYVKLIAVDRDGVSLPGPQASGFTVRADTADIKAGAITAGSAILADLAVEEAKIANLAVTTGKIQDLAVGTAKIAELAVTTAKIDDLAVTTAKIQDLQVTTAKIGTAQITNAKINDVAASKITTETLYATLTTSGTIRTSPGIARTEMSSAGLYAYADVGGVPETRFAIDSAGNAYFRGNVYAVNGTFTGSITSSATITGGTIRTSANTRRVQMSSVSADQLDFFSGGSSEVEAAHIRMPIANESYTALSLNSGKITQGGVTRGAARIDLFSEQTNLGGSSIFMSAQGISADTSISASGGLFDNGYRVYSPWNTHYHSYGDLTSGSPHAHNHSWANITSGDQPAPPSHNHSYSQVPHNHAGEYWAGTLRTTGKITSEGNMECGSTDAYYRGASTYFYPRTGTGWTVNGNNKTFVIDHPTPEKNDTHYLVHSAIEGPTADVFYRGRGRLVDLAWEGRENEYMPRVWIELPDYFEDLTEVDGRTVMVTPIVGECDNPECTTWYAPNLATTEVRDGKFMVCAVGGFQHNCASFYWEVKAVRKDVQQQNNEPLKSSVTLVGDGPYTYLV